MELLQISIKHLASQEAAEEWPNGINPGPLEDIGFMVHHHGDDLHAKSDSRVETASTPYGIMPANIQSPRYARPGGQGVCGEGCDFVCDQ